MATPRLARLAAAGGLALALGLPAGAQDGGTRVFLQKGEALAHVFPGAERVVELRHILAPDETARIEALLDARLDEGGFFLYAAQVGGTPVGYAAIVAEIGKVKPITHIVEVRPDGTVGRVAVMIYRESHGADVASPRFLAQYEGRSLADPLRVNRDIINIAGSTLSAHAICRGVRKALAVVQVVLLDRDDAARRALLATATPVAADGTGAAAAAARPGEPIVAERAVMGTLCRIEAWPGARGAEAAERAVQAALDVVQHWDDVLSDWRPDTPLSRLNAAPAGAEPASIDEELGRFLVGCRTWVEATHGAFDPTVGALVDAWRLRSGAPARPDATTLAAARAATGWELLQLDADGRRAGRRVAGLRLDPGASGKGWALDRAAEVLRNGGVSAALLSFRSSMLALGAPPGQPGWIVPIVHDGSGRTLAELLLVDGALSVSGGAAAGFADGDVERGSVLDPREGLPVPAARLAWARHPTAAGADALSTALLVAGPQLPAVDEASGAFLATGDAQPLPWPTDP